MLIDLGNTRLKWAQQTSGDWHTDAAVLAGHDVVSLLDKAWRVLPAPEQIVISSVSSPETLKTVTRWIERNWSIAPHILHAQVEQLGVKSRYTDPATLGVDRWAALIAVRGLTSSPACIIDCGTAVTVDALSADGEFLGGVIFPGLHLLRSSLARGTHGIKVAEGNEAECFARSTADGVAAGTLFGLAGALEHLIQEYRKTLGKDMQIFLTGGDAARLAPRLNQKTVQAPDLVLKGLARVADSL
ncbi:MAG: type III pantothenate kinase [Pseudomonadota bacterium]